MEKLLQFVWQHRLGLRRDMKTVDGRSVRVLDQGTLNTDAGPDFFNASVEIDGQHWAGNIEIHVKASDWYRHGHHNDPAYDSVILHVVQTDDMAVTRADGSAIPQLIIKCTPQAAARCNQLTASAPQDLPCRRLLSDIPSIYITDWLTALAYERLYVKSDRILHFVNEHHGAWAEAAYHSLARALGFGLNSQPFEQLANSLPLNFLMKHRDDLTACEALFFGQAGLLPPPAPEEAPYITEIRQHYLFLADKFSLRCTHPAWKMGRTRPQNLPHRRIAYLAQFICYSGGFIDELECARTLEDMRDVFDHPLIGFWASHYTFSPAREKSSRAISRQSIDRLLINLAIPLLHARAVWRGDIDGASSVIELLEKIPPEDNSVTRLFAQAGIINRDAFISQAIIQLRREYCEKKKCIYCRFGHRMLSNEISR